MEPILLDSSNITVFTYSVADMLVNVAMATIYGFFLSYIYQVTHKGLSYSQTLVQTIVLSSIIVSIVIMVIGSSLVRAFALIGALSIIRYRTVLKDTKDLTFIFASLVIGMACGTGNFILASIGLAVFSFTTYLMFRVNYASLYVSDFLLHFRKSNETDTTKITNLFEEKCKSNNLLNIERSDNNESSKQTYDIILKKDSDHDDFIRELKNIDGISEVVFISSKSNIDY